MFLHIIVIKRFASVFCKDPVDAYSVLLTVLESHFSN